MDREDAQAAARKFALGWIEKWHKEGHYGVECHSDPLAALKWYCSYNAAQTMLEVNSSKDWAHVVLEGLPAMSETGEEESFFNWVNEEEDGLIEDWHNEILQDLKRFFGIDKEME